MKLKSIYRKHAKAIKRKNEKIASLEFSLVKQKIETEFWRSLVRERELVFNRFTFKQKLRILFKGGVK